MRRESESGVCGDWAAAAVANAITRRVFLIVYKHCTSLVELSKLSLSLPVENVRFNDAAAHDRFLSEGCSAGALITPFPERSEVAKCSD